MWVRYFGQSEILGREILSNLMDQSKILGREILSNLMAKAKF